MPSFVSILFFALLASATAAPVPSISSIPAKRQAAACTKKVLNFDDEQFSNLDPNALSPIPAGFEGFDFKDFFITSCPGKSCKSFPAETTQTFTGPRLAMSHGLVGGLLVGKLLPKTSPSGQFNKKGGSFDINSFSVFDIIDLPEQVKLGAKQDMRVHLDCGKADSKDRVKKTIPFNRNKDSAGYLVENLGADFTNLTGCKISTTQVFFPFGKELEIPTESMGLDNLDVCVRD